MDATTGLTADTLAAVQAESRRALAKHGVERSALGPVSDADKLAILVEEVGEVAHALTYDSGEGLAELYKELVQVANVAACWAQTVAHRMKELTLDAVASEA